MSDREEAAELLRVARRDLRGLKGMVDPDTFADELFGFVAQQAAEKALKAWLCVRGQTYPFTHDVVNLLALLEDYGEDVDEWWSLAELNPFAVALRYSSMPAGDTPLDRKAVIERTEALIHLLAEIVGPQVEDDA